MKALVIYRNETPLHMGSRMEIGFVDMPIQREKHTGFPKAEASGIKGVFNQISEHRKWFGDVQDEKVSETNRDEKETETNRDEKETGIREGKLIFTDAKLLFLPVRSAIGLFAWVTCPYVLSRFFHDIEEIGEMNNALKKLQGNLENGRKECIENGKNIVSMEGNKVNSNDSKNSKNSKNIICLEEYSFTEEKQDIGMKELMEYLFTTGEDNKTDIIYAKLKTDVLIVSDEIFSYFCDMGTEVTTRIRIGENGVVEKGALFTEEFLPENSVLYNVVSDKYFTEEEPKKDRVLEQFIIEMNKKTKGMIQLGGGTTIGKGITSYHFILGGGRQ